MFKFILDAAVFVLSTVYHPTRLLASSSLSTLLLTVDDFAYRQLPILSLLFS